MTPRAHTEDDVRDLLERWQEVLRSTSAQLSCAPPRARAAWETARERAQAVVAVLQEAARAEREANRAWWQTRVAERKGAVALRLVQ